MTDTEIKEHLDRKVASVQWEANAYLLELDCRSRNRQIDAQLRLSVIVALTAMASVLVAVAALIVSLV